MYLYYKQNEFVYKYVSAGGIYNVSLSQMDENWQGWHETTKVKVKALKNHRIKLSFNRVILSKGKHIRRYQIYRKMGKNGKYKRVKTVYKKKFSKRISLMNFMNV